MQQRLESFGGDGEPLVFAHANGYPVGSYRRFLTCLTTRCRVTGYHHRPLWSEESAPAFLDWSCFAGDLVETLEATQAEPVWMAGHSLGAVVSVQAAARHRALCSAARRARPPHVARRLFRLPGGRPCSAA